MNPDDYTHTDENGFSHWHEVPYQGQFRLRSNCTGCDFTQDLDEAPKRARWLDRAAKDLTGQVLS